MAERTTNYEEAVRQAHHLNAETGLAVGVFAFIVIDYQHCLPYGYHWEYEACYMPF